jgi:ribonucleoside-diphosphate reductase alpha chain
MGILDVSHPDIEEFIQSKTEGGLTNFNISVGVTEAWMDAASRSESYDLINPRTGKPAGQLNAGDVLGAITEAAWTNGDPGIIFLDRMNEPRTNPTPALGPITATNPCGEQPLLPFEACVLGSINLGNFVTGGAVDWERMGEVVSIAVRFLDNAVERSSYPIPEIHKMHKEGNRKIGLGVMGWADMLVSMGIPYDSEEALEAASRIMEFIGAAADAASEDLARERGSFSNWEESVYGRDGQDRPIRNATRTTIAPTGTISIIAGCSSGIEPLFAISFHRKIMEGILLTDVNTDFERAMREAGAWSESIAENVAKRTGTRGFDDVPESIQRLFPTAHEIAPDWHVRHQAAFQRHVDSAVSKTINLPKDATIEDVAFSFELALELGCKGITVYRDGSRSWQVLNKGVLTGTDLGTIEGSPPAFGEGEQVIAPMRGQSVLELCPVCGLPSFEFAEACGKCHSCGHSTC